MSKLIVSAAAASWYRMAGAARVFAAASLAFAGSVRGKLLLPKQSVLLPSSNAPVCFCPDAQLSGRSSWSRMFTTWTSQWSTTTTCLVGSLTHTLGCVCAEPHDVPPPPPLFRQRGAHLSGFARASQGKLKASDTHNSTTRFEIVELPKLGTFGWNNSLAGVFVYSPLLVTRLDRKDNFTYRAVNEYGESNWAVVNIEFVHDNESDGILKALVGIALISTFMSLGGLVRVVILQLLLNPDRRFQGVVWQSLKFLANPPVDPFVSAKSADDYKVKLDHSDEEETENPLREGDDITVVDDTDEFT